MAPRAWRLVISGRVQGVGYRAWFVRVATAQGLSGFVRNRRDGSVEAVVAGPEPVVRALIEAAWSGPPASKVTAITTEAWVGPVPEGFDQAATV